MALIDSAFRDPAFQWNERTARHLLNRAGFGVPPAAVKKLAGMAPEAAVAAFVDYETLPDVAPAPPPLPPQLDYREMRSMETRLGEVEARKYRQERQRERREAMTELQAWWVDRMCRTQRPLQEKMTLFWHGHFATSAEKVQEPTANLELNQVMRNMALGNFRELTRAVGKSQAMLRYLDQQQSSRQKPNENWARELMELFTLGIGNYTETDIKEAARAFTGWSFRDGAFFFVRGRHDPTHKVVLGLGGLFDGDAIIDLVTAQPACPKFICTKLWKFFAYDEPEPEVVEGLAATMRNHDMQIKPVLKQLFSSKAFYQEKAFHSQVKSPAQLVVNLLVQLGVTMEPRPPVAQLAMRAMGQSLFYPPNVKGWDGGKAWINTNTLLVRYNFANYLVSGVVPALGPAGRGLPMAGQKRMEMVRADEGMMQAGDERGGMMQEQEGRDAEMPVGQDAMPRDIPAQTLYRALGRRREERRAERIMDLAPFEAREFFKKFEGKTGVQILAELEEHFLGFPLERAQREKLLNILAQSVPPDQPVPVARMAEEDLRATIQLLLSTAEYQVC